MYTDSSQVYLGEEKPPLGGGWTDENDRGWVLIFSAWELTEKKIKPMMIELFTFSSLLGEEL